MLYFCTEVCIRGFVITDGVQQPHIWYSAAHRSYGEPRRVGWYRIFILGLKYPTVLWSVVHCNLIVHQELVDGYNKSVPQWQYWLVTQEATIQQTGGITDTIRTVMPLAMTCLAQHSSMTGQCMLFCEYWSASVLLVATIFLSVEMVLLWLIGTSFFTKMDSTIWFWPKWM